MKQQRTIHPKIHPYRVDFPQADLDDLNERLSRTRWPDELTSFNAHWDYGVPVAWVRELVAYWRTGFDWRAQEARLNAHPQFVTRIDGTDVHFLHVTSPESDALPLVLTHGWPGSVFEFLDLIGPLTDPRAHGADPADAFHVVVPSLPGFGLSGPTREPGWDRTRVARAWIELVDRLGYGGRWGAHGGDVGSLVGRELGVLRPDGLVGTHVTQVFAFPGGDEKELAELTPEEHRRLGVLGTFRTRDGYQAIQSTRPQTLAYGLTDSPAGQLAWNAELFNNFGDVVDMVDRDAFLANVALYWLTGTAGSAARIYYEDSRSGAWEREEPNTVPTGVAVFPDDFLSIRRFAERANNITHWTEFREGGHFAALEVPELLVGDIRRFFGSLR
ncbi:epoxide hydrolase family protein [Streptomyces sp. NPDC006733]|uniref:epoxide hydrolase family protein n=1 Tax=Streptomyces sp. NPDC006733 TaxID=3155460 RepID=UPI0033EDA099